MTYQSRRRQRVVVMFLVAMMAMPPGMGQLFAASRTSTQTRMSGLETFRNPQLSGGLHNRFLYSQSPSRLIGGGGDSAASVASRGYGRDDAPMGLWLPEGRMVWDDTDLVLPGVGMPLVFQRVWRGSVTTYDGPLGKQWDFNWNKRLYEDTNVLFLEMGREESYTLSGSDYTSPAGRYDTLAKDTTATPDIFTRTDKYGTVETYEDEGSGWYRITEIKDLNDNTLTFAYDGSDLLTKVTDTLSQDTTLAYDGNGRITKITDPHSRDWVYSYGSGYLDSVRTPTVDETGTDHDFTSGKTTSYEYDSGKLTKVFWPDDGATATLQLAYNSTYVTAQTLNGAAYSISYSLENSTVTVTDRESDAAHRYTYNGSGLITLRELDHAGTPVWDTTYTYNSDAEVTLVAFPEGNELGYSYDSSGNITKLQFREDEYDTTDPVEWNYAYNSDSRMTSLTDPNGKVWSYAYDTDGNLTRKTWPAVTLPSGIATADKNSNSIYDGTMVEDYEYTASGLLTKVTDPVGTVTEYTYSQINSTDAYLDKVKRDTGTGNLNIITDYDVDGAGNVTKLTDPEGNITTYTVNDLNQTIITVEPLSVTRNTYYDANDRVTKTTVTNDTVNGDTLYTVLKEYDPIGNMTKLIEDVTSTGTLTTTYVYDDNDRLTKQTSPEGVETRFTYDERGLLLTRTLELGTTDANTTNTYDLNGNRTKVTDALGNETTFAFDALDRLTKTTSDIGNVTDRFYDDAGNVTKVSSFDTAGTPNKLAETTTSFDEANRVYKTERMAKKADLSTNLGDGQQTKTVWRDEAGRVLEYSDDVCGCSNYAYVYDALGRRVTTKDPMPTATQNSVVVDYDDNGNVTKRTSKEQTQDSGIEADKDIVVEYVFDARNRLLTRKDKIGASTYANTVYAYGKRDNLTKVTDADGDIVNTEYNEQLWKTKVTQETSGDDVITEYVYDDDGRVLTYRAKNSTTGDQETKYTYDLEGLKVTTEWPDTEKTLQTYDLAGQRISTTDPMATVVVRGYDADRRMTSIDITPGVGSNVVGMTAIDYAYDGLGRITSADTTEGSFSSVVERDYNTLGKIESETQIIDGWNSGAGRTITYGWNVAGQKTSVTYPVSGDSITYTRDELDRVDTVSRNSTEIVDYAFNGKRVIEKAFPGSVAEMTYDTFGRLTQIHHEDTSSTNTLLDLDYGYDDSHRVTHMDKTFYDDVANTRITANTDDLGDQYAYDGAGRLVTVLRGVPTAKITTAMATNITNSDYVDKMGYVYDQTGNRLTRQLNGSSDTTYEHNKVNEMTKEDTSTLAYDDNGNFEGASNTYKYDWRNQLAWMENGSNDYTWHFDAFGRGIQRDKVGVSGHSRSYYDGNHLVERVNYNSSFSTETLKKTYVFGERIDELLMFVDVGASPDVEAYSHADKLGSIMLLVDSGGAIQESYRYKEWGEPTILDGSFVRQSQGAASPIGNPFMYTGQKYARAVAGSGEEWYDYRARHLRADAGRFVQRDPLEYVDGGNMYAYVGGSPLIYVDPYGTAQVPAEDHSCTGYPFSVPEEVDVCCVAHDDCYDDGGDLFAKHACDITFLGCLQDAGWSLAKIFYKAVVYHGGRYFNWNPLPGPPGPPLPNGGLGGPPTGPGGSVAD